MLGVEGESPCRGVERVVAQLLNRRDAEKLRVIEQLRAAHPGLPVVAYGNSSPDLVHMRQCEEAVYVNADPALAQRLTAAGMRCVQWR